MNEDTLTDTFTFTVTPAAAARIKSALAEPENAPHTAFRVFVVGGGCSGFQYGFKLENRPEADDIVLDTHGVKVLVDPISMQYLSGATVDFSETLQGSVFKIDNPIATSKCGCGSSFSV
jgi:iron-sulfur cluster insertion protein